MARAVLVQHHAGQRLALALAAVGAAPLGLGHDPLALQRQPHEVVRASPFLLAVLAVEVLHRPADVAVAILIEQPQHLIDRRAPSGHLPQPMIDEPVQAVALIAAALPAKLPLRHIQ